MPIDKRDILKQWETQLHHQYTPSDVVLNISPGVPIPRCPLPGHQWRGVVHNPEVTWLAYYRDSITNAYKYVYLASSSRFKGDSDRAKYNVARRLTKHIDEIRRVYTDEMKSSTSLVAQRATAMYLVDFLALRAGTEKDTSEEADTVGCCSLRVEHLSFKPGHTLVLDFLGKDSMRYFNEVVVEEQAYKNLQRFCAGKRPDQEVFHELTVSALNKHLSAVMPGLSAKVFRTYNASVTLEKELRESAKAVSHLDPVAAKQVFYTAANREVAVLCNHQRSVPKGHGAQMEKLQERLAAARAELAALLGKQDVFEDKKLPTDPKKRKDAAARVQKRVDTLDHQMTIKDDNKAVALGTSKINYMDPRITVAWCKSVDMPIEKVFNKSLLSKFPWAMEVPSTWRFADIDQSEL